MIGGWSKRELDTELYKQVWAFWTRAQAKYMVPTGPRTIFRFFLNSRKAKYERLSSKTHSTAEWTLLIEELNTSWSAMKWACLRGTWRWTLRGMLGHRKCTVAAVPHRVSVVGVEKANQTCEAFLNHASYPLQGKKKTAWNQLRWYKSYSWCLWA